jgi:bacterioferritin-associated ferredoxin
MLVCICKGINDRRIREEVQRGARSVSEVARACRAGTDCGSCVGQIREIVEAGGSAHSHHDAVIQLRFA